MTQRTSVPAHIVGQSISPLHYESFEASCAAVRKQAPKCTSDFGKFTSFTISGGRFYDQGDAKMARRAYSALVEAVSAGFAAVAKGTGTFEFPFEGQTLIGVGGPLIGQNPHAWKLAYTGALAFRKPQAIAFMMSFPAEQTARAGGERDVFPVLSVVAMQAFHRGDADWEAAIDRAQSAMDPAQLRIATPSIARVERSLLEVMRAVGRHDRQAFTDAIVEALKAHKAYWTKGANKQSCHGALCLPVAGFAALGVDRGLKFEVESGYAPRWLVEGTEP